jgi:hypothetical protein
VSSFKEFPYGIGRWWQKFHSHILLSGRFPLPERMLCENALIFILMGLSLNVWLLRSLLIGFFPQDFPK